MKGVDFIILQPLNIFVNIFTQLVTQLMHFFHMHLITIIHLEIKLIIIHFRLRLHNGQFTG